MTEPVVLAKGVYLAELDEDVTAEGLARQLHQVRSVIDVFRKREADLVDRLAAEMTDSRLEVPEIGVFERRRKNDRKSWQHEEIRSALLRKMRAGEITPQKSAALDTGEVHVESEIEMTFRVLAECANPSWRTTALKRYDLDPDEFCSVTPGGYSVQFIGNLEGGE